MNEVWKLIPGWSNYEVSNLGNVRSLDRIEPFRNTKRIRNGRIMRQRNLVGYQTVSLKRNGKGFTKGVHKLVALAWLPNPENFPVVNHVDFDKTNNVPSNLEWCTQKQNIHHSMNNGFWIRGENHGNAKITDADALFIKTSGLRAGKLKEMFSLSYTTVQQIRKGAAWKHVAVN